jgi:hypothetical protein
MPDPTDPMTPESYQTARARAKFVKESEWMRVYELKPKHRHYESKFLSNEAQMSADSFAARWPLFSVNERLEFVLAYHAKGDFTNDDERIIDMIMRDGDDHIWSNLALFMIRHPVQSRVLAFFRARLEARPENPFNYIQALGEAKDREAEPVLRTYFDQFRPAAETERLSGVSLDDWNSPGWRFLTCCEALWKVTGSDAYENDLRTYVHHPNSQIRWKASHALGLQ